MTSIFTRKAVEFWQKRTPPPELAYLVDGRVVTWSEVMEKRRDWQRTLLDRKRDPGDVWRAAYVLIADYGSGFMGGWQTMLYWIGGHCWVERDSSTELRHELMNLFPLILFRDWGEWKVAFARRYQRRRQCRQPVGVAFLWKRGHQLALRPDSERSRT